MKLLAGQPQHDERDIERRFREYRVEVRGVLHNRFPHLSSDAREELYQEGWVALLKAQQRGQEIANEAAYIQQTTLNLARRATASADAHRRITFDPTEGRYVELEDDSDDPSERIAILDQAAVAHALLRRLTPKQFQVAKRRYVHGDPPDEICSALGMKRRRYEKTIDSITVRLGALVRDYHAGELTKRDEQLLSRCILGEATEAEREEAKRLVTTAHGRALLCNLRHAFRGAAIVTPLPLALPGGGEQAVHGIASIKEQAVASLDNLKSSVGAVIGRSPNSITETATSLSATGAGRGTGPLVAGITACVIGTAGGVCAVTGTAPSALLDPLTGHEQTHSPPAPEREVDVDTPTPPSIDPLEGHADAPAAQPVERSVPVTQPAPESTPAQPQEPQLSPGGTAQAAPPANTQEFGYEQNTAPTTTGQSHEFGAPAPPPTSPAEPAPAEGGTDFGFEN